MNLAKFPRRRYTPNYTPIYRLALIWEDLIFI
jgi:1-aminocyclopropane-1-carboxylate deaminase/D-cysteine desulfhydrase-like pyridoxal-dependent ACC family enzyme